MYAERQNPSLVELDTSGRAIGPRVAGSFGASVRVNPAPEGCREGAEGAGLVSLQTSPLSNKSISPPQRAGDTFEITFDKVKRAGKRVKRLRRNVWAAGHLHGMADKGKRPPVAWFVTLTYVGLDDWRADHMSAATEQFRRHCARVGVPCRYIWVAELQKRGAVHYHMLAWLPKGVLMPHWDKAFTSPSGRSIGPFWSHGMTNTQVAKSGVGYLMKYLSKLGDLTVFPPHLRLSGCGGLSAQARGVRCWYNLPEWAKREHGVGDLKRQGSRLIVLETGEILPPMYSTRCVSGGIVLTLLRPMPERWHDGAYSTWANA
jgi:hypothetical protein